MSAPTYADVKALFVELEGLPREERAARLAAASPTLRAEVEALLDANSALDDGFMEPVLHMTDLMNDDSLLGTRIGAFRVERVIGEGGMGRVYAASRDDGAFEQTVALKVVKRGMDTEAVLRRFEAERRILARLRHPGIARLIDGGETEDGRPYVAMELVDGEPLTAYADRFSLGVEDRVRLLAQVCFLFLDRRLVQKNDLTLSWTDFLQIKINAHPTHQVVNKRNPYGDRESAILHAMIEFDRSYLLTRQLRMDSDL